jgi:prepilin-type N-terminal cleavage/methylation domain-containing protein
MHRYAAASRDAHGFSMVELLVAVVLASIVFAAMVPLFVSASQKSSGDKTRNIATNVAQGRIDSLQLLGWSQLTASNIQTDLQSSTFAGGLFGDTYSPPGSSAVYPVTYTITPKPSSVTPTYVRATVTVTTPALKGSPAYTASMTTIILNPTNTSTSTSTPVPSPSATPAPSLTGFTPATGPAGTNVTLTGTGFLSATAVSFNSVAAPFTVVSNTQITTAVPIGASTGKVSVTNPAGTATSASDFTVTIPTSGPYKLTVLVSGGNWVNPTTGITVVQTNVTPNFTDTPSPQFPTTTSNAVWSGLPAGTFLVTCNYYKSGKTNGNGPKSVAQTVTISDANQQITFNLTQ